MTSEQRVHRSDRPRQCVLRRENRAQTWAGGETVEDGIGGHCGERRAALHAGNSPLPPATACVQQDEDIWKSSLFSQLQFPCLCSFKDPLHPCQGSNPLHLSPPALLFFLGLYPPDWDAEHLSTPPLALSQLLGSPSEYKDCHVYEVEVTIQKQESLHHLHPTFCGGLSGGL